MAFAINPPTRAIADKNGYPTPEFYRFLVQIQRLIGQSETNPFDEGALIAATAAFAVDGGTSERSYYQFFVEPGTLTAGAGLTGGGNMAANVTVAVGAGTGITVNADDIAIADTAVTPATYGSSTQVGQFTVDQQGRITLAADVAISASGIGAALAATTMTAGAGLTGGGDLSANRTFDVGAGTGITVNANDVAITATGVSAAAYGSASAVGTFTVNAQGQLTAAADVAIAISAAAVTSGTLAVARGGTALSSTPTNGQLLIGNGTNYTLATITGTASQVTVTNGSGTITLSLPSTINVNTSGSAATLTTPRAIYGNNFDGSAAITAIIASTYGGTGNGFTAFSGPATTEKTFTLPNASATILTSNAAVTVGQGGTGAATFTADKYLKGNGTSAIASGSITDDAATVTIDSGVGFSIARTGVTSPAAGDGNVFSGLYTPTITNGANVDSSTASECQYMRVGNVVLVSGSVTIDATASATDTVIDITLPIASSISASRQLGGAGASATPGRYGDPVSIFGNTGTDEARFALRPTTANSTAYAFSFTYRVI